MPPKQAPPQPISPLAQVRLNLPDRPSQTWVADQISDRIGETVGQQAVSYWEKGKVDLRNVHPRRLSAYAEVLKLSKQKFAEMAGYEYAELFPDEALISPRSSALSAAAHYPDFEEEEEPIEDALAEAVRLYGDLPDFEGLTDPVTQRALQGIDFRHRPQTPQEWLAKFLKYRDDLRSSDA